RAGDSARDRHAAGRVAERGALHHRSRRVGAGERAADAAAAPERGRGEAAFLPVGAAHALPVATHVDQPRIDRAEVRGGDAQATARGGQEVRQEYIGGLDQPAEQLVTARMTEVDADRALAAVRLLDHEVDRARPGDEAGSDEAALRVTAGRVLDLDDVCTP